MSSNISSAFLGFSIGDALGVPVEFRTRAALKKAPITGMIGHTLPHCQPPGTWSDDSSLAFCLAESLCNGYNLQDIASRMCQWRMEKYWTPHGSVFDIGGTTNSSIHRLVQGVAPTQSGGQHEYENGNGSLMRILPLVFYLEKVTSIDKRFEIIHEVSGITHAHPRSKLACSIYLQFALHLLSGLNLSQAYQKTQQDILAYYQNHPYQKELVHFQRILQQDISMYPEDQIFSDTYVIHTLEASFWCLLLNHTYSSVVLTAVELGDDTDTTAAIAGGLAGLYYGEKAIPEEWKETLARKQDILDLANRLESSLQA